MQNKAANELIDKIIDAINGKKFDINKLPTMLMELREYAKKEEDPMSTRILRHMAEHIQENGTFEFTAMTDEDEEGELFLLDAESDQENLAYIMQLFKKNTNETNRKELFLMGEELKAAR
jgi:hypothetical protein